MRAGRRERSGTDDGFSLLEVIVSIGLFVVVATATALVVNRSIQTQDKSQARTGASATAQEILNGLRDPRLYRDQNVPNVGPDRSYDAAITFDSCAAHTQPVHIVLTRSSDGAFLARTDSVLTC